MTDTSITQPTFARDPVTGTHISAFPDVFVSFTHADTDHVKSIVEAMRVAGLNVLAISEVDPRLWGQDITSFIEGVFPERCPVAIVFFSTNFEKSFFHRELETLVHRAGPDMRQGLIVPARLDDAPLPVSINQLASLDTRAFQPAEFAAQVRKVVTRWQETQVAEAPELTDEQLLERYRKTREPDILNELWIRLYPKIIDWIRSKWANEVDAIDVAVRTFSVLWPRLRDPLPNDLSFTGYAFLTASRIARGLIRERTRSVDISDVAHSVSNPAADAELKERILLIQEAIRALPETEREIVVSMIDSQSISGSFRRSLDEVAGKLGLAKVIVYRRYKHALETLNQKLSKII